MLISSLHYTDIIYDTAQKLKFSIKDFFGKCDQIRRKLQIWSHLLKKSLMENFFCAMEASRSDLWFSLFAPFSINFSILKKSWNSLFPQNYFGCIYFERIRDICIHKMFYELGITCEKSTRYCSFKVYVDILVNIKSTTFKFETVSLSPVKSFTARKMKFFIKDFFSKCDQILNGKIYFWAVL